MQSLYREITVHAKRECSLGNILPSLACLLLYATAYHLTLCNLLGHLHGHQLQKGRLHEHRPRIETRKVVTLYQRSHIA